MDRRALALCLCAGLAAAGVVASSRPPSPAREVRAAPRSEAASPAEPRLEPGASVRVIVAYEGCGIQRSGSGPLPPGLVGLDRRGVAAYFRDAVIGDLTPELLVLERRVPGCPDDTVTLLDRGGFVTAVAGRPGDLGPVIARTDLRVRALHPADREAVERGLPVPEGEWQAAVAAMRNR